MHLGWKQLTVSFAPSGTVDLMETFRWLIGNAEPLLLTVSGDAFLQDHQGYVFWLDVGTGQYTKVAEPTDNMQEKMKEHVDEWFLPNFIGDLIESGKECGANQCFSVVQPILLGGNYSVDNFVVMDVYLHFHKQGQILQQIKDLPKDQKLT